MPDFILLIVIVVSFFALFFTFFAVLLDTLEEYREGERFWEHPFFPWLCTSIAVFGFSLFWMIASINSRNVEKEQTTPIATTVFLDGTSLQLADIEGETINVTRTFGTFFPEGSELKSTTYSPWSLGVYNTDSDTLDRTESVVVSLDGDNLSKRQQPRGE
jgi:hypothetical protein